MIDGSRLRPGDRIAVGDSLLVLDENFCASLQPGDSILGVAATGTLRRIPSSVRTLVSTALQSSVTAFAGMQTVSTEQTNVFFGEAARLLADDRVFAEIQAINALDVEDARGRGRSTTRLEMTAKMRDDMVEAFRMWGTSDVSSSGVLETIQHDGWRVSQWRAPLGVVAFVFEGRPNVFADATGVLKSGNTVVFRIGSDALRTARRIMELVITPSLQVAGLPTGAVVLLDSPEHAAGWCLFSDRRVSLAVARGSGEAVAELGSIAQQAGVPVSLHGTGGAWMIVGTSVDVDRLEQVTRNSLDRKVCNTLNVVAVCRSIADVALPRILAGAAGAAIGRGTRAIVRGADSEARSRIASCLGSIGWDGISDVGLGDEDVALSVEFEWENEPEFQVALVDTVDEAVALFNEHSPQFIVSVVSNDPDERDRVWSRCNAPFVGDGFTRWVDGQFALLRPELGLSNWQNGRLLSRSGVLSGDSAYTIRLRVEQEDPGLSR